MEHNKNPRNFREIEDADMRALGNNPLCGDAFYNTKEEVDKLADAVQEVIEVFA